MPKIKTVRTFLATYDSPEGGTISQLEERDEQENILMLIQFNHNGEQELKTENVFDDQNRLLETKQYSYTDEPDQIISYTYDEGGFLKQEAIRYLDGSFSYKNYERDVAEKSYWAKTVDEDGELEAKEYRRFDGEGKVLEEKLYEEDELQRHTETTYDDHGRHIKIHYINPIDGLELTYFYEYVLSEQGQLGELRITDLTGKLVREELFSYDERGNQSEREVKDMEQGAVWTDKWSHDENSQMTQHQRVNPDGSLRDEVQFRYRTDGLLAEEERRTTQGVTLKSFEYELFPAGA